MSVISFCLDSNGSFSVRSDVTFVVRMPFLITVRMLKKRVPCIAVTTPVRHDYTLASLRLLIVSHRQRARDTAYWSYVAYLDTQVS